MDEMGFTAWYDHPVANSYPRKNGKTWIWCAYDECAALLKRGDRVRIKNGYEGPGDVYYYLGKSAYSSDTVMVASDGHTWEFVADAIEPYPYSREERIERAIEDFLALVNTGDGSDSHFRALLFAILDAGV